MATTVTTTFTANTFAISAEVNQNFSDVCAAIDGKSPWVYPELVADSTAAAAANTAALNAVTVSGEPVLLPMGKYYFAPGILVRNGMTLRGSDVHHNATAMGPNTGKWTEICFYGAGHGFIYDPVFEALSMFSSFSIGNITVSHENTDANSDSFYLSSRYGCQYSRLHDLAVHDSGRDGIALWCNTNDEPESTAFAWGIMCLTIENVTVGNAADHMPGRDGIVVAGHAQECAFTNTRVYATRRAWYVGPYLETLPGSPTDAQTYQYGQLVLNPTWTRMSVAGGISGGNAVEVRNAAGGGIYGGQIERATNAGLYLSGTNSSVGGFAVSGVTFISNLHHIEFGYYVRGVVLSAIHYNWNGTTPATKPTCVYFPAGDSNIPEGIFQAGFRQSGNVQFVTNRSILLQGFKGLSADEHNTISAFKFSGPADAPLFIQAPVSTGAGGYDAIRVQTSHGGTLTDRIIIEDSAPGVGNKNTPDIILTNANLVIGDGTNQLRIAADGTLTLEGSATVFEDVVTDAMTIQNAGSGITANSSENTKDFSNTSTIADYLYGNMQFPHRRKLTSTVFPHIHWTQAAAGTVNWLLEYRWQKNGGAKTTAWTRVKCNTLAFTYTSGSLNQISYVNGGIAPPSGDAISDILQYRVSRDKANASGLFSGADTTAATVSLVSYDAHIEADRQGSSTEYAQ